MKTNIRTEYKQFGNPRIKTKGKKQVEDERRSGTYGDVRVVGPLARAGRGRSIPNSEPRCVFHKSNESRLLIKNIVFR